MELKQSSPNATSNWLPLLIVPYGIETEQVGVQNIGTGLLIVPYGIETMEMQFRKPLL